MNLQTAVRTVLGKYADFSGRARRSEYWYWSLVVGVIGLVLNILSRAASPLVILYIVWILATLVPNLAVLWRRLHDTDRSGAWFFIGFVPIVGFILLLVWLCGDSKPDNQYGPNPKGLGGGYPGYGQPPPPGYGYPPPPGYGQQPGFGTPPPYQP